MNMIRTKRDNFEKLLLNEKRRMDGFRVKEINEKYCLKDLKDCVLYVDYLFDSLEVKNVYKIHKKNKLVLYIFT